MSSVQVIVPGGSAPTPVPPNVQQAIDDAIAALGGAAELDVGTIAGTVAAGDDSRIVGAAQKANNGSDFADIGQVRVNLGLGGAAVLAVGTATGTVAAGDDSRITGAAQKASNLSDLTDFSASRINLGLGSAAVLNIDTDVGLAANSDTLIPTQKAVKGAIFTATAAIVRPSPATLTTTSGGGNITLSGEQTIDGTLTSATRVLVRHQTDTTQNGVYISAAGAWIRAADADSASELIGAQILVTGGSTNAGKVYVTDQSSITVGSTPITFTQIPGGVAYVAGTGLNLSGSTFSALYGTTSGTAAQGNDSRIKNTGTAAGTVAAGDDSRIVGAWQLRSEILETSLPSASSAGARATAIVTETNGDRSILVSNGSRWQRHIIVNYVEDAGVVGGAAADAVANKTAFNTLLAETGKRWRLKRGELYRIGGTINVGDGVKLEGPGDSIIYMPDAYFTNTALTSGGMYGTTGCGVAIQGLTSSPYTVLTDVLISGFKVQSQGLDGRAQVAILARNLNNFIADDIEVYGLPVGAAMVVASVIGRSFIDRFHAHDFYTNAAWGGNAEATGIEIDNNRINGVYTDGLFIRGASVHDLTYGATAIAAIGDQGNGIKIVGDSAKVYISDYHGHHVGQGFDCYSEEVALSNFDIHDCAFFGLALKYGARKNVVSHGQIKRCGISGIDLSCQDLLGRDMIDNQFSHILIEDIAPTGTPADSSACIRLNGATGTYTTKNNTFSHLTLRPVNAKYAVCDISGGGVGVSSGNRFTDIDEASGATGRFLSQNGGSTFRSSKRTVVSAYRNAAAQTISAGATTKIGFDTEIADERGEFDTSTNTWTCQIAGAYRARSEQRIVPAVTGAEYAVQLRLNGGAISSDAGNTTTGLNLVLKTERVVVCAAGDTLDAAFVNASASSQTLTAGSTYSHFSVERV